MPSSTDVLAEAGSLVQKRLDEIEGERRRLERALAELNGDARRKPGRPRKSTAKSAAVKPKRVTAKSIAASKPRRRRKGGTRADQAVDLIAKNPGISASDIAKAMKIKPNYLYRVLGDLEQEKRVKKDGRNYTVVAFD